MLADLRLEAGGGLRARRGASDREAARLPAGASRDPVVQYRTRGGRTHDEIAFLEIERRDGMQKSGWRRVVVWADAARTTALAVVETEAAEGTHAVYRIVDGNGAPLARVTRRQGGVFRMRRTSWLAETPDGTTLRAIKGGVFGWIMFWLFSPLWAALFAAALLGGDVWRMPVNTIWRRDGAPVLQFTSAESTWQDFAVRADWADGRLAVALVALQHTHLPWRDRL